MKQAYLVDVSLRTRVVANLGDNPDLMDSDNLRVIRDLALPRLQTTLANDFYDNLEEVYPDEEVPYDPDCDQGID